jgi:hypothetical protein
VDAHIHQTRRKSLNKHCLPARELMATVFWDRKGLLMEEFMQRWTTITSEVHCQIQKILRRVIQNKRRGMLSCGVVLLLDSAHPRTAARTRALLEHFNWELFDLHHQLTSSDYHLFTYLRNWLRSQRFSNNEDLMEGVKT